MEQKNCELDMLDLEVSRIVFNLINKAAEFGKEDAVMLQILRKLNSGLHKGSDYTCEEWNRIGITLQACGEHILRSGKYIGSVYARDSVESTKMFLDDRDMRRLEGEDNTRQIGSLQK